MPQHPTYSNSPIRDINRLSNLLAELVSFGLAHEDIYSNIDTVMFELYRHKCSKLQSNKTDLDIEDDEENLEEFEDSWDPTSSELFYVIPKEDRPQYIQDLRNTIAHCMSSNSWSTEGVSNQIVSLRDIKYYKYGVQIVEDTDVLEKYKYRTRSIWYPTEVTPFRMGIYEISTNESDPKHSGFSYWDGKTWYQKCILLTDCINQKKNSKNKMSWNYCWRGLSKTDEL
jgi:hypothetical protein